MALVIGVVLVLVRASDDDPVGPEVATTGQWLPMAAAPLSPRIGTASAWTGRELVAWGGRPCREGRCDDETVEALADGAAYDPETDTWRSLAPSPLSPRSGATATIWTGQEVLVWGGRDAGGPLADGAAYDPEADTWRPLAAAPLSARSAQAVWSGREMLVWGGTVDATGRQVFADGAAYDPEADTWRPLAPSPLAGRFDMVSEWTDGELVVWGGRAGSQNLGDGAAYDPAADAWRPLASSPLSPRVVRGEWSGRELLIWGGEQGPEALADGAAYDPAADTWRPLAPSSLQARRGNVAVWSGRELLIWGGGGGTGAFFFGTGAGYDPEIDAWRDLPPAPGRFIPDAEWSGEEMLVWGGIVPGPRPATVEATVDGARYRP